MLIKDLKNVKDEEITLQDVKRAEEIIERANKLLGRKSECNHWHGWSYFYAPTYPNTYPAFTYTSAASSTASSNNLNVGKLVQLDTSLTEAVNNLLNR